MTADGSEVYRVLIFTVSLKKLESNVHKSAVKNILNSMEIYHFIVQMSAESKLFRS